MGPVLIVAGAIAGGVLLVRANSAAEADKPVSIATAKKIVPMAAVVASRGKMAQIQSGRPAAGHAATPVPGKAAGPAPAEPKPSGLGIKLPGELGAIVGAIPAAAKTLDVLGTGIQNLTGSEAAGNVSRVVPVFGALGFLGQKAGSEASKLFGADENTQKTVGRFTGLLVATGPGALGVPIGEGALAVVGAVGGQQAAQDVRNAVAQLDPTSSTSAVGQAVNNFVNTGFGLVKGIFG